MRGRAERNESFAEEDQQFHHLLFRCQNNRMLTRLIEVFWIAFYKASNFANLGNPDPMQTWRDHPRHRRRASRPAMSPPPATASTSTTRGSPG